jgi:hypothetical protein
MVIESLYTKLMTGSEVNRDLPRHVFSPVAVVDSFVHNYRAAHPISTRGNASPKIIPIAAVHAAPQAIAHSAGLTADANIASMGVPGSGGDIGIDPWWAFTALSEYLDDAADCV